MNNDTAIFLNVLRDSQTPVQLPGEHLASTRKSNGCCDVHNMTFIESKETVKIQS
ncbi:hypothetical protein [Niallia nealsonii]|uniref:hypothetical protein n=1 Tax=Niallia nealsonii TaxID=115979 RepID=UPI0012FEB0BB|nr:hypothetical protein [Niallia nealsonii]